MTTLQSGVDEDLVAPATYPAASLWCDAAAYLHDGRMVWLGGRTVTDPLAGLLWIGWRAGHIAEQIDSPLARPLWAWREDADEHARAVSRLLNGETYALVVQDDDVVYVVAVTPTSGEGETCDNEPPKSES